jgi:hypothetical protein
MDSLATQEEGLYQICFTKSDNLWNSEKMKISGMSIADALWLPSGITLTLQSNVLGLNINGVLSRGGIINYMPAHLTNTIQISRKSTPSSTSTVFVPLPTTSPGKGTLLIPTKANVTCTGDCEGCVDERDRTSGTISDGLSTDYWGNANCKWLIASTAEILLSFKFFDTEAGYDFVTINRCTSKSCDSVEQVARLSAKEKDSLSLLTETYTSSTKYQGKVYLQVVFTSDATNSKRGFVASWWSTETIIVAPLVPTVRCSAVVTCGGTCGFCPGVAVSAGLSGNFSSGSYRNRDNCWWLITAPKDSEVNLSFTSFETEPYWDVVRIYTSPSASCSGSKVEIAPTGQLISPLCSTDALIASLHGSFSEADKSMLPKKVYTSTTGVLKVLFTSDDALVFSGFTATWSVQCKDCDGVTNGMVQCNRTTLLQDEVTLTQNSSTKPRAMSQFKVAYEVNETIAMLPSGQWCENQAPASFSGGGEGCNINGGSSPLKSTSANGVVLWGGSLPCVLDTSLDYQVCFRAANATVFSSTGIAIRLHTALTAVEINDVAAGDGHRATALQSPHNHVCVRVSSTELNNLNTTSYGNTTGSAVVSVSIIAAHLDCQLPLHNPVFFTDTSGREASGHINLSFSDQHRGSGDTNSYQRGDTRTPLDRRDPYTLLFSLGARSSVLAQLPAGAYQFCIRFERNQPYFDMHLQGKLEYNSPRGSLVLVGIGSGFWPTGVGLQVQNMVQGLSVNYLTSGRSLQAVAPAMIGNRIQIFFRDSGNLTWNSSDAVSVRLHSADCLENPFLPPPSPSATFSILPVGRDLLLDTRRLAEMSPGLYQLCMHFKGQDSLPTGLSLRLQNGVRSLAINSIRPARGLRAAVAATSGNSMSLTFLLPLRPSDQPRANDVCSFNCSSSSTAAPATGEARALPFVVDSQLAFSSSLWIWFVSPMLHCNESIRDLQDPRQIRRIAAIHTSYPSNMQENKASSGNCSCSDSTTVEAYLSSDMLDMALGVLEQGVYQICVSEHKNTSLVGTGISLRVQGARVDVC